MDKNDIQTKWNKLSEHGPNVILVSKPFYKVELVNSLSHSVDCPVILVDFDLLFSGYANSKMVQVNNNVHIIRPKRDDWDKILRDVMEKMYKEKLLLIIDSFNGFHNMCNGDSTRFVNASLMLFACAGRFKRCQIVIMALARKNQRDRWILSSGGGYLPKRLNLYSIKDDELVAE